MSDPARGDLGFATARAGLNQNARGSRSADYPFLIRIHPESRALVGMTLEDAFLFALSPQPYARPIMPGVQRYM